MSHKNDVKNAEKIFKTSRAGKFTMDQKLELLRKKTNWTEDKIRKVYNTIREEGATA